MAALTSSPQTSPPITAGTVVFIEELVEDEGKFIDSSIRLVGRIENYQISEKIIVLSEPGMSSFAVRVSTQFLAQPGLKDGTFVKAGGFKRGALFMFIGEWRTHMPTEVDEAGAIKHDQRGCLVARVCNNVDGLDTKLYKKAVLARRTLLASMERPVG
jgi:hypothetical protein